MNAIAPAIKRRRVQLGLTEKEMGDKMHRSEKVWHNIENGITRLDMELLQEIADALEMSLLDLINSQETVYINIVDRGVGYAQEVVLNNLPIDEAQRDLYNRIIEDKDEQIRVLRAELASLKVQVNGLVEKLIKR
jgi:transcriptional regulator with XRE-family HTH domain